MFRKALAAILVLSVMLSIGSGLAQQRTFRIGAAVYGLRAEFMQLWVTALERHPAVQAGLVEVTVFDGRYDASVQQSQFETMVVQRFDGIIFVPIDVEAGAFAVETAAAAGIPVVGSNTRVASEKLLSYIGSNDVLGGYIQAKAVIDMLGGQGNVVILEGPLGQSAQIDRRKGNLQALEEYPGINVLAMQPANWSRAEALALMESWLIAFPGQIDGVIGQNDEMALGAIEALRAADIDPATIPTSGIDGISDSMLAVQRGEQGFSILQDARAQAEGALDILLRHLIGEEYEPLGELWTRYTPELQWGDTLLPEYVVPWTVITLENVEQLLEERKELTER